MRGDRRDLPVSFFTPPAACSRHASSRAFTFTRRRAMRAEPRVTPAHALMRLMGAALMMGIAVAWGCADFEATVDPTGGLPDVEVTNPSFANDIQPIFTKRCSIGGCHSLGSARGDLVLV